jgi:hypothetical protein
MNLNEQIFLAYIKAQLPTTDLCYRVAEVKGQNVDIFLQRALQFTIIAMEKFTKEVNNE